MILFRLDVYEKTILQCPEMPHRLCMLCLLLKTHNDWILFGLDVYEKPILEGSKRLLVYLFPERLRSKNGGPGEGELGRVAE